MLPSPWCPFASSPSPPGRKPPQSAPLFLGFQHRPLHHHALWPPPLQFPLSSSIAAATTCPNLSTLVGRQNRPVVANKVHCPPISEDSDLLPLVTVFHPTTHPLVTHLVGDAEAHMEFNTDLRRRLWEESVLTAMEDGVYQQKKKETRATYEDILAVLKNDAIKKAEA